MMHSTVAQHPLSKAQPVSFTGNCSSHTAQAGESRDWENEEPFSVEDQVQDPLRNLKVHSSLGSDEVHVWALREQARK